MRCPVPLDCHWVTLIQIGETMLETAPGPYDWAIEPVPSARAVSILSASAVAYDTVAMPNRRPHALASLLVGTATLAVALTANLFGVNGYLIATAGIMAVVIGAAAMWEAPFVGAFARVTATLGMTMGLASATLMLLPHL